MITPAWQNPYDILAAHPKSVGISGQRGFHCSQLHPGTSYIILFAQTADFATYSMVKRKNADLSSEEPMDWSGITAKSITLFSRVDSSRESSGAVLGKDDESAWKDLVRLYCTGESLQISDRVTSVTSRVSTLQSTTPAVSETGVTAEHRKADEVFFDKFASRYAQAILDVYDTRPNNTSNPALESAVDWMRKLPAAVEVRQLVIGTKKKRPRQREAASQTASSLMTRIDSVVFHIKESLDALNLAHGNLYDIDEKDCPFLAVACIQRPFLSQHVPEAVFAHICRERFLIAQEERTVKEVDSDLSM